MPERIDLTERAFGRWKVLRFSHSTGGATYWDCLCTCGRRKLVSRAHLRSGMSQSCGCLRKEICQRVRLTHGHSRHRGGAQKTSEYMTWQALIQRCENPKQENYPRYGGRGIKVCERWRNSFENFLADMGRKPTPEHSIDRKENDGNYEPRNCHWATPEEQRGNRSHRYRRAAPPSASPLL